MSVNDITIRSERGEITLYGSATADNGVDNFVGYKPPLTGFGDPGRRVTTMDKSGSDGGIIVASDMQYGLRQIPIDAFAFCKNADDVREARRLFREALPIRENVLVFFVNSAGDTMGIRCVVSKCASSVVYSSKDGKRLIVDYTIELLAADPAFSDWSESGENEAVVSKAVAGGILWGGTGLVATADGWEWTDGNSNVIISNSGSLEVFPTIEIRGVVHNPIISNITSGRSVSLNITTGINDVILIDMDAEVVTLNGVNIRNNLIVAEWWGLGVGDNMLSYTSGSSDDVGSVTLRWRNRFMDAL